MSKQGLDPWVGENPKVLILGTMPGDMSLRKQAYYCNTIHNSFWKILRTLFPDGISDKAALSYEKSSAISSAVRGREMLVPSRMSSAICLFVLCSLRIFSSIVPRDMR